MGFALGFIGIMLFGWASIGLMILNDHSKKGR